MARLPIMGSDSGSWGDVLNEYLGIGHLTEGVNMGALVESEAASGLTLAATDNETRIVVTAAITISVPAVGVLGDGLECELINDSAGTVTIDGPGSTNISMSDGEVACVIEANSKRVVKGEGTLIS